MTCCAPCIELHWFCWANKESGLCLKESWSGREGITHHHSEKDESHSWCGVGRDMKREGQPSLLMRASLGSLGDNMYCHNLPCKLLLWQQGLKEWASLLLAFSLFVYFNFLSTLCGMWDLRSPTRHWTCVPCSGSLESQPLHAPSKSPWLYIFN